MTEPTKDTMTPQQVISEITQLQFDIMDMGRSTQKYFDIRYRLERIKDSIRETNDIKETA